jgi:hypothetical protein
MMFWEGVAVQRAAGPVTLDEQLNFPEPPAVDEQVWQKTLEDFRRSNRAFRDLLGRLDPARLDQNTPGGQKPLRVELLGIVEHHIYHAGQISLLKKAFALQPAGRL